MTPFVSVVIPTFNRRASLLRLLDALAGQTYPPERFEVLVVDDGSTDGTREALTRLTPPYRLAVLAQANQGPGAARNLGVGHAGGELILFLDDDTVPVPGLVDAHVGAHLEDRSATLVAIGPMLPPPDWKMAAWVRWEAELLQAQYADLAAGTYPCGPRQFYTANASLRRVEFSSAGGFDVRYRRAEDVELAYRLRDRGAVFLFLPNAAALHYASRTFASWRRIPYQYGRYDVVMHQEAGHEALPCAFVEFHHRHFVSRLAVRLCLGRPLAIAAATFTLCAAAAVSHAVRAHPIARHALSGLFTLLYWQGVADELGGAPAVWRELVRAASGSYPNVPRPAPVPAAFAG